MPQHHHYWKKWPDLDFKAAEEVSVFRIVFYIFYDAVVGSSSQFLDNVAWEEIYGIYWPWQHTILSKS